MKRKKEKERKFKSFWFKGTFWKPRIKVKICLIWLAHESHESQNRFSIGIINFDQSPSEPKSIFQNKSLSMQRSRSWSKSIIH